MRLYCSKYIFEDASLIRKKIKISDDIWLHFSKNTLDDIEYIISIIKCLIYMSASNIASGRRFYVKLRLVSESMSSSVMKP